MPCYRPVDGYIGFNPKTGKQGVSFYQASTSWRSRHINIRTSRFACKKCLGCLFTRSRDWTVRCSHQQRLAPYGSCHFVTWTFNDEFLPRDPLTGIPMFQENEFSPMIKRLRKNLNQKGIKYFGVREYGSKLQRPHYHAVLFNCQLDDYSHYKRVDGYDLFNSRTLSEAWSDPVSGNEFGFVVVAPATRESISYVSRYTIEKLGGVLHPDTTREYYIDPSTGEVLEKPAERSYVSNRPAIGFDFFDRYKESMFNNGHALLGNKPVPIPSYYIRKEKELNSALYRLYVERRNEYFLNAESFNDEELRRQEYARMLNLRKALKSVR